MISITAAKPTKHVTLCLAKAAWSAGAVFRINNGPTCTINSIKKLIDAGHAIVIKAGNNDELFEIIHGGA